MITSTLQTISRYIAEQKDAARRRRQVRDLHRLSQVCSTSTAPPHELFRWVDDELWLSANTVGYREFPSLREILPALADEGTQMRFTGASGDDALVAGFHVYKLFKQIIQRHNGQLSECGNILDFGCGWGRVIRFFLKDIDHSRIWGVDCLSNVIEISKATNKWCNFSVVDPLPPTAFPDSMFDVVYGYSVFSHLSEDAHWKWLGEFHRILKDGGLLVVSTRSREFVEFCARLKQRTGLDHHLEELSSIFEDPVQALTDYDGGKYTHRPVHGGDILSNSFYGETCIPKDYVIDKWTSYFTLLEFIDDRSIDEQNIIVARK